MAWHSRESLLQVGFASVGEAVQVSTKASIYGAERIHLGNHVRIDDFAILSAGTGGISIGNHVHIAPYCGIFGAERVELGHFSGLSSRVCIYTSTDDYGGNALTNPTVPARLRAVHSAPVVLGKHVIVGTNSTLLPGVTLANGCAVAAHSLVTKGFDALSFIGGSPARFISRRSDCIFGLEEWE